MCGERQTVKSRSHRSVSVVIAGALPDEAAEDQAKLHLEPDADVGTSRTPEEPAGWVGTLIGMAYKGRLVEFSKKLGI